MVKALGIGFIVFLLAMLLALSSRAQSLAPTLSCDVTVNGYTVTFPKGWLRLKGCQKMMRELRKKDETGADIQCVCQIGNPT